MAGSAEREVALRTGLEKINDAKEQDPELGASLFRHADRPEGVPRMRCPEDCSPSWRGILRLIG